MLETNITYPEPAPPDPSSNGESSPQVKTGCGKCGKPKEQPEVDQAGHVYADPPLSAHHASNGLECWVDWITWFVIDNINRLRNLSYKVISYQHAKRIGIVSHYIYHLRSKHCDACDHSEMRALKNGKGMDEFCNKITCRCGNTKRSSLTNRKRLAGHECPINKYGLRNAVVDIGFVHIGDHKI